MNEERGALEATLGRVETHERWERAFRTAENERFYDLVFDRLEGILRAAGADSVLDAGCGRGAHSVRLAKRGFNVVAVDLPETTLALAQRTVSDNSVDNRVSVAREDITSLSFAAGTFRAALCWGVLMHIPDVGRAVAELARVVGPGGVVIVAENNRASPEAALRRAVRMVLRRGRRQRTPAGDECWKKTAAGPLFIRMSDVSWLIDAFSEHGLRLERRWSSGFTEAHTKLPIRLVRRAVHGWNRSWFERNGDPRFAFGNILVFRRPLS